MSLLICRGDDVDRDGLRWGHGSWSFPLNICIAAYDSLPSCNEESGTRSSKARVLCSVPSLYKPLRFNKLPSKKRNFKPFHKIVKMVRRRNKSGRTSHHSSHKNSYARFTKIFIHLIILLHAFHIDICRTSTICY